MLCVSVLRPSYAFAIRVRAYNACIACAGAIKVRL